MNYFFRIATLLLLGATLWAAPSGSLSVYAFKNGTPLPNSEVIVDETQRYTTDRDGAVRIMLESGTHQLQLIGKDAKGVHLGFYKKPFSIVAGRNTQIVASFDRADDPTVSVDTPLETQSTGQADLSRLGTLVGFVRTSDQQRPITNARIFVKGTGIDARTDEAGRFEVQIPADVNVSISIVHSEYSAATVNDLVVAESGRIEQSIELTPASMELEEFIVLAPKIEGSIASVMLEEKESKSISNILSSEEMSKKGDSSAASALRRVTGVTLIGGKNIFVRGLGERYSNIELNGMPLPSPDPLKRVVPLDIFPSGVIASMKVQKSATADIPSSFGGGYVDIRTKDKTSDDYIKVGLGVKANSYTGEKANTYQGSDGDYLGFDDGYREINEKILKGPGIQVGQPIKGFTTDYYTKEELSAMTQSYVNRNYNVEEKELPYGFNGMIEGAANFEPADGHKITFFGHYKYDQEHTDRSENYYRYQFEKATGNLYKEADQYGTTDLSVSSFSHGAILNIGYNYEDVVRLKLTKLYTHNADKVTKITEGIMGSNDENMTKVYLMWQERTMDVNQFSGDTDYALFDMDADFSFGTQLSSAKLYQPNDYHYTFRNEGEPFLDHKISNNIGVNLNSKDDLTAYYLKNKLYVPALSEEDYIEVGYSASAKSRESRQNKFFLRKISGSAIVDDLEMTGTIESIYDRYVRPDLAYADRSLLISQLFQAADYYDAEVDESAWYINAFTQPTESLEFLLGVRMVDLTQAAYQYREDRNNPDMSQRRNVQRFKETLSINSAYPSLSAKYKLDEANQFDAAVSKTFIVPDLREFSSGEYFHPYEVATVIGNPNLKNTDILSLDLKYSHFFSDTENVKFGLFYKILDKPIEDVMIPSSSLPIYSFDNSDQAVLYGFELDGRKQLAFIDPFFSNYFISGNFSYTDSEVTLTDAQKAIYSSDKRQLQGLSQTVINLSTGYDTDDRSAILSYNKMGERIRKVGMIDDGDRFPDHTEYPAALLDLVWIEKFNNALSLNLKLSNLLDEATEWKQGDRITQRFKTGRFYALSMSYKF
ncbi:MAG: TonB-dependent receptor plug domain-containing protein [Campylobacterales bacterium]|nr:TonB-dependent receptor plug domain-containing protein [Campylobacterales bacterium]